jgi:translation initiation factor RLI1
VYEEYRIYKNYMELLHKNGLSLHILKRYLGEIGGGLNVLIGEILKKEIEIYVEKEDIIIRINVLSSIDNNNYNIMMLGGKESLILDVGFKIVMSGIACLPKSNIMWIDEGVSVLDRESQSNIKELFNYLTESYENVLLISHIEGMKDYVNKSIKIRKDEGGSKIEC